MDGMHDQDATLNFVVGGMPRGGTTYLGQLFNLHPDVFCYVMETALFRELSIFAADRPLPPENMPVLEAYLRADLRMTVVDGTEESRLATFPRLPKYRNLMLLHGLAEPSGPGLRVWDAARFETFLEALLALFRNGLYGPELFAEGARLLARQFRQVTARPVLGEKTPDNLFHLDALHAADPNLKVFAAVREPHATIESMKRRALRNRGFGDSAFAAEVRGAIADYYHHLRPAYEFSLEAPPGVFHVHRYEDLLRDPAAEMELAFAQLGLETPKVTRRMLPQMSLPTPERFLTDEGVTPAEHRLVEMICGPMLRAFGYEDNAPPLVDAAGFEEGIIPLSGFHAPRGAPINEVWIGRRADLYVLYQGHRKSLYFNLGVNLPPALSVYDVAVEFEVDGVVMHVERVPAQTPWFVVELPLPTDEAHHAIGAFFGARIIVRASAWYVPISVAGAGPDLREISVLVREARLV